MERARAQRHSSVPLQTLDESAGASRKPVNNSLVVFHRRALRHDQRNDPGARGRDAIDSERAVDDAGGEAGIFEHRVIFADDLRGQLRPHAEEPRQFGFAALGRNVVGHDRTKGKGVNATFRFEWHVQFVGGNLRLRKNWCQLPERQVFFESDCVELV